MSFALPPVLQAHCLLQQQLHFLSMHHLRFVAAVVLVVAGPGEMTRTCLVRQQLSTCSKRDILLQTEKRTLDWRSVCFLSFPQIRAHSAPQN